MLAWLADRLAWLSLGLNIAFGFSRFSLHFAGFSFLFLRGNLFSIGAYVYTLFTAGFQLVLQACLALFDLIYFLHLIKKKKTTKT